MEDSHGYKAASTGLQSSLYRATKQPLQGYKAVSMGLQSSLYGATKQSQRHLPL